MKKITTIFVRDWEGTLGPPARFVTREPHPDADWVFAGEGIATRKLDGTACMLRNGTLFKRFEVRPGKDTPKGFREVERDEETDKVVGWVPVGEGPEDKWYREARGLTIDDTYELVGPKVQGNPEGYAEHTFVSHSHPGLVLERIPRDFFGLGEYLAGADIEGIVWHHPDGRMAKIKAKDFGISRKT